MTTAHPAMTLPRLPLFVQGEPVSGSPIRMIHTLHPPVAPRSRACDGEAGRDSGAGIRESGVERVADAQPSWAGSIMRSGERFYINPNPPPGPPPADMRQGGGERCGCGLNAGTRADPVDLVPAMSVAGDHEWVDVGTLADPHARKPLRTAATVARTPEEHRGDFIAGRVGVLRGEAIVGRGRTSRGAHHGVGSAAIVKQPPHTSQEDAGMTGVPPSGVWMLPEVTRGDGRWFLGVCILVHAVCLLAHAVIGATPLPHSSPHHAPQQINLTAPETGAERIQAPPGVTPSPETATDTARSVLAHGAVEQRPSSPGS